MAKKRKRTTDVEEVLVGRIRLEYMPWENAKNTAKPSNLDFAFSYFSKSDMRKLINALKNGNIGVKAIRDDMGRWYSQRR